MTIAELIAELEKLPPSLDVWLVDEKEGITFPMNGTLRVCETVRRNRVDGWYCGPDEPTGVQHVELE